MPGARLTDRQVFGILNKAEDMRNGNQRVNYTEIAAHFNCNRRTVQRVNRT